MINPIRWFQAEKVDAHCDIPCGIYDPITAKMAAQTVQKMVLRIHALEPAGSDAASIASHANTLSRYVAAKEEHAEVCKHELRVLWADYFRPEHIEAHPDLHTKVWNAEKLAGRNKQTVDMAAAEELVSVVDEIATIFWATKNVEYSDPNAAARYGA